MSELMKLKPVGDRLIVKPIKKEEITSSGIVLPDTVEKEQKAEGEILSVGTGEKISKLSLSVGQKVIYKKYGGEEVEIEKTEYKILDHDDVLAIIE